MTDTPLTSSLFLLDVENQCLLRGGETIRLPPQVFTVLRYLVEHPNRLVTKEELFQAAWAGSVVSDAALAVCICETRKALGDNPKASQFIKTVHRRGVQFIGTIGRCSSIVRHPELANGNGRPPRWLVGREAELGQLHTLWEQALQGERQIVFITGEVGIGKTTLVEAFIDRARTGSRAVWIGQGQCIEPYGVEEAYRPVLRALGRLCRQPDGSRLIQLLQHHAPTWLIQMPTLLSTAEFEALQPRAPGATQERMLRELAEALEVLTTERPLILILEDLHWSDYATLSLLAWVAREQEWARLLIIGTYRPVEAIVNRHPLRQVKQELQLHGQCQELLLDYLTQAGVQEYLTRRFAGQSLPTSLAKFIYQRTDGNPLFMVTLVDAMLKQGLLAQENGTWKQQRASIASKGELPESLCEFIEHAIGQLRADELVVLEAASVVGTEFSPVVVAAGIGKDVEVVEDICAALVRRKQFLQAKEGQEKGPDGTVGSRYVFIHRFYQELLHKRVPTGRRMQLWKRMSGWQEARDGKRRAKLPVGGTLREREAR